MIERSQLTGDIIGTLNMDTFISVTLAVPLYACFFIIISVLFVKWRITLILRSFHLTVLIITA